MKEKELITITDYKIRKWGSKGKPLTSQSIRNMIRRGDLPGEKIGHKWFIDASNCKFSSKSKQ